MLVERREGVTRIRVAGQRDTGAALGLLMEGGSPSVGGTSRMSREVHVRSCEGLGVKFPGATGRMPDSVALTPSF